jgi:hypothetical protein
MFGGDDLDRDSLHGDRRDSVISMESYVLFPLLSRLGMAHTLVRSALRDSDRASSRFSIVSLAEREYGWSTNARCARV